MKSVIASVVAVILLFGISAQAAAQEPLATKQSAPPGLAKLDAAIANFGRMPFHNGSRIHASELSPDGKLLATLSSRSATVWNMATGQPLHRFFFDVPAWPGYRRGLAFSPDGKRLACGPTSEHILVWDLASGKEVRRFATEFEMFGFSFFRFSADSQALIVESHDVVSWLNIDTGAMLRKLSGLRITELSADDKTFAVVLESKNQVLIGDARTGKIAHTLPIAALRGSAYRSVLFLPDGVTLAAVHHLKYTPMEIQLWDITTGKRRDTTWPLPKSDDFKPRRLAHSPDGKVLYFMGGRYALDTGKELTPFPPCRFTTAIFPHPDGKTLVAVGLEEIRRWDLSTQEEISKYRDFIHWRESAIAPDGRWLALCGGQAQDGFLDLCDTQSHQVKRIAWPWGNAAQIAFTSDSRSLAVNQHYYLQFLSVPELKEGKRLTPPTAQPIHEASITFSKDGRRVATRSSTGHLRLFDVQTEKEFWAQDEIWKALFTPDSKQILLESRRNAGIPLYELATKKAVLEFKQPVDRGNDRRGRGARITAWAFSPDGRVLAVAMTGGHVILLDAATGKERARFLSVPIERLFGLEDLYLHATALAFSPDGQWLASGGDDGYLRIWEVSTRRELHRLHGHEGATQSLGFTADGRRLVSFGDGEGFLWDLRPGKENVKGSNPIVDLLSQEGPTVYRAVWAMADDPNGPAMLRERIPPKRVDARPERIAQLIADLDADQFEARNTAVRSLAELEGIARFALARALAKNPTLEMKRRIEKLLGELDTPTEPALRISRAIHAMELNGSDAARKLLRDWSEGTPGLRLTEESRAALVLHRTGAHSGK